MYIMPHDIKYTYYNSVINLSLSLSLSLSPPPSLLHLICCTHPHSLAYPPPPLAHVNNVNASGVQPPASAIVTWDAPSPFPSPPTLGYQVVYRLLSSTIVQFKDVDLGETQTTLTGLQDSSMYKVYVRLVCSNGVGPLSDEATLTLVDASELCLLILISIKFGEMGILWY